MTKDEQTDIYKRISLEEEEGKFAQYVAIPVTNWRYDDWGSPRVGFIEAELPKASGYTDDARVNVIHAKAVLDRKIAGWPYTKEGCGCASCAVKRALIELRAEMFGEEQTDDAIG